jgi:hypothetical protein
MQADIAMQHHAFCFVADLKKVNSAAVILDLA